MISLSVKIKTVTSLPVKHADDFYFLICLIVSNAQKYNAQLLII